METMYFILGISLVVVVAMAAATIWSILQIVKNQKTTEHLQRDLSDITAEIQRQQKEMERDMYDAIQNQVMTLERQLSMIHELIDNSKRYTDSRIDKIMNDPKFCLNTQTKKQLND